MEDKSAAIELNDVMECLKDQNNKLLNQLSFAQKCMKLFEDYRKCLIGFASDCVCEHNVDNQITFSRLELNYKLIVDEDMKNSAIFPQKTINVEFNKQKKVSETNDKNNECIDANAETQETIVSNEVTDIAQNEDNSASDNVLSDKLSDSLKNMKNLDKDYQLMYLKSKRGDSSEHFQCNWFKCKQIFASEANLSQHIRSEHFRVLEYSDDILFDDEPQEMIIKCEPDINPKLIPEIKLKPKRVFEEYVCEWIGCELEFRTESELRRHEVSVHSKQKQSPVPKIPRFSGLKPLTIHTLDLDTSEDLSSVEKPFKCDLCDKSYTRKDSLKYHMNGEHRLGEVPIKMFYCDHCEYQSKNNSHMKRHILRRHTNERPYKCDLGDCHPDIKCFATLDQLRSHQLARHPTQIF